MTSFTQTFLTRDMSMKLIIILFNQQEYLMNLFENYVDNGLNFARKKCVQAMQQVLFYILPTTL